MSSRSWPRWPHRLPIGVGVLVFVILCAVGFLSITARRTDGPLHPDPQFDVKLPLRPDTLVTWGSVLPVNPTDSVITIEAIEAIHAEGLEIIGMLLSDPVTDGGIGTAEGFPPEGIRGEPVAGAHLGPANGNPAYLQVLVGIRLSGMGDGSIQALRVRYRYSGASFEVVLPFGLQVISTAQ